MKKLVGILFLSSLFLSLQAQTANERLQAMKANTKGSTQSSKKDRIVVEWTMDNWFYKRPAGDNFKTRWYSQGLGLYYMHDIAIKHSRFSVAPGAGFGMSFIYMNGIAKDDSTGMRFVSADKVYSGEDFKRARFFTSYLDVPVELRYRSAPINGKNSVKVAVGFKAGIRLNSRYTLKAYDPVSKDVKKTITTPFKDVEAFRFGPTFRVGYGAFNLFTFYNVIPVFKSGKELDNSKFQQFSIGLSVNGL